jgi:hypothetical protein
VRNTSFVPELPRVNTNLIVVAVAKRIAAGLSG